MIFQSGDITLFIVLWLQYILCQLRVPSAQNFKSFAVQAVAPGSRNFKKLIKSGVSKILREGNDLRNGATVN